MAVTSLGTGREIMIFDIWYFPITNRKVIVDGTTIKSKDAANAIMK